MEGVQSGQIRLFKIAAKDSLRMMSKIFNFTVHWLKLEIIWMNVFRQTNKFQTILFKVKAFPQVSFIKKK